MVHGAEALADRQASPRREPGMLHGFTRDRHQNKDAAAIPAVYARNRSRPARTPVESARAEPTSRRRAALLKRLAVGDPQVQIKCLQMRDVRAIGGQGIFDNDQLQVRVRMLTAQSRQQALGGVTLAVVFRRPVGFEDRLGGEREDFLAVWMHQHRAEHLVMDSSLEDYEELVSRSI